MAASCAKPPVLYRGHQSGAMVDDPQASDLWRLIDQHFDSFQQVYDERYQAKYGYWRPIIEQSVTAYLKGMIGAIQTFGQLLHWNPHIHSLVTCGAYTPEGEFLHLPEFDMDRLLLAWQEAVFSLYLSEDKIEPEVVENMRSWDGHRRAADQNKFRCPSTVLASTNPYFYPQGTKQGSSA